MVSWYLSSASAGAAASRSKTLASRPRANVVMGEAPRFFGSLTCGVEGCAQPTEQFPIDFFHGRQAHLVVAHAFGRLLLQSVARRQVLHVQADLDLGVGRRARSEE